MGLCAVAAWLALVSGCTTGNQHASETLDPFAAAATEKAEAEQRASFAGVAAKPAPVDRPPNAPAATPGRSASSWFGVPDLFNLSGDAEEAPAGHAEADGLARSDEASAITLVTALIPDDPSVAAAPLDLTAVRGRPSGADVSFWSAMGDDWLNFYSPSSLAVVGVGVGVGAIIANTDLDVTIQDGIQRTRSERSDEWSKVVKEMGNGAMTVPIYASAMVLDCLFRDDFRGGPVAVWGERSLRATVVGAPLMLVLQRTLGASRPEEVEAGSRWSFWADNNGVSGHAFMGAIPFLTAAKLSDEPWVKLACYGGSFAVGWSRMNDDAHYPSQVMLGWSLAYLATCAVESTDLGSDHWQLVPLPVSDGLGLALQFQR